MPSSNLPRVAISIAIIIVNATNDNIVNNTLNASTRAFVPGVMARFARCKGDVRGLNKETGLKDSEWMITLDFGTRKEQVVPA